jgi:hypothetical protein
MNGNLTPSSILKVCKPVAAKASMHVQPADRPTSLNNKTIGLVWNGKPGGDVALGQIVEFVINYFHEAKFKEFFYNGFPFTKSQIDQIATGCDVVVGTTGD